jgi:hypothetical protein
MVCPSVVLSLDVRGSGQHSMLDGYRPLPPTALKALREEAWTGDISVTVSATDQHYRERMIHLDSVE